MAVAWATVLLLVAMTFVITSSEALVTPARLADVSLTVAIVTMPALPAVMSFVASAAEAVSVTVMLLASLSASAVTDEAPRPAAVSEML